MNEYRGIFTLPAAATYGYADIDPPEREGYVNKVAHLAFMLSGDDTANNGISLPVGLSVKASVRTSFDPGTEGFAADLLGVGTPLFKASYPRMNQYGDLGSGELYLLDDAYFQDTVRMFVGDTIAVAAGKEIQVSYRMLVEPAKLTTTIAERLARRCFS